MLVFTFLLQSFVVCGAILFRAFLYWVLILWGRAGTVILYTCI